MALTPIKFSALSAMTTLSGTEEFPGVQGGVNGKGTAAQIKTYTLNSALPSYTVATLPTPGTAGRMAWASDCRVFDGAGTQEGVGAGTGGLVTDNGAAWKIAGTNVTAVA